MNNKKRIKSIRIRRAEGKGPDLGKWFTFDNWDAANKKFREWRELDYKGRYYDKCDFVATWDGQGDEDTDWTGIYCLHQGAESEFMTLQAHIKGYAEYSAGLTRPEHFSDENWGIHLQNIESYKDQYADFLNTHSFQ